MANPFTTMPHYLARYASSARGLSVSLAYHPDKDAVIATVARREETWTWSRGERVSSWSWRQVESFEFNPDAPVWPASLSAEEVQCLSAGLDRCAAGCDIDE